MKTSLNYFYTNKIDELYMRDRNYELHLRKLQDIQKRGRSDSEDVEQKSKLKEMNSKRRYFDQESLNINITRNNARLLTKIVEIQQRRSKSSVGNSNDEDSFLHYKNFICRKNEAIKIAQENEKIAIRLIKLNSQVKPKEFNINENHEKFKVRLHKFQQQVFNRKQIRSKEFPHLSQLSKEVFLHDSTYVDRIKPKKAKKKRIHSLSPIQVAQKIEQDQKDEMMSTLRKAIFLAIDPIENQDSLKMTESNENTLQNFSQLQQSQLMIVSTKYESQMRIPTSESKKSERKELQKPQDLQINLQDQIEQKQLEEEVLLNPNIQIEDSLLRIQVKVFLNSLYDHLLNQHDDLLSQHDIASQTITMVQQQQDTSKSFNQQQQDTPKSFKTIRTDQKQVSFVDSDLLLKPPKFFCKRVQKKHVTMITNRQSRYQQRQKEQITNQHHNTDPEDKSSINQDDKSEQSEVQNFQPPPQIRNIFSKFAVKHKQTYSFDANNQDDLI